MTFYDENRRTRLRHGGELVPPPTLTPDQQALRTEFCRLADDNYLQKTGVHPDPPYAQRQLTMWDGGTSAAGRNYQPRWQRLLDLCQPYAVNPYEYLASVFADWLADSPPDPGDVLLEMRVRSFKMERPEDAKIREEFKVQQAHAQLRFSNSHRLMPRAPLPHHHAAVIFDVQPPVTALYRYCYAVQHGFPQHAAALLPAAAAIYRLRRSIFDLVWGDFLPPLLRQADISTLNRYADPTCS